VFLKDTPAERVTRLREDELGSLRDDMTNGRRERALRNLTERFMAEELVRDQYSGRYPFELIQNASDAVAEKGGSHATVRFNLTETALIVADQGDGFGADQVEAISGFANSSKDPRKTIGYKGLGFKSVKDITSSPQIFSSEMSFGFDDDRARRMVHEIIGGDAAALHIPHYRFPFEITRDDAGPDRDLIGALLDDQYTTVIRLPFMKGITREAVGIDLVDTLNPRLLLFLNRLERLELCGTNADFTAGIVREDSANYTDVLLECNGADERFLLFSSVRPITDRSLVTPLGGAWEQVDRIRLFAAIPLDGDLPSLGTIEPLHVYFPTEEATGLPLILSADFQMEFDRRKIATTPKSVPYNEWLTAQLADFVTDVVLKSLLVRFEGHPNVARSVVFPATTDRWPKLLRQYMIERLVNVEFVPCADGDLRDPSESELQPASVPDAAYLQHLLPDLGFLVHPDLDQDPDAHQFLADELGTPQCWSSAILKHLDPSGIVDVEHFYLFLVQWGRADWTLDSALRQAHCVRLIDGRWVKPEAALMPPQRGEIEFPPDLAVPVADLPDVAGLQELLTRSGLRSFDWRHVIVDHLMPTLRDPLSSVADWNGAMKALRHYYDAGGRDARIRSDASATLLAVRDHDGGRKARIPAPPYLLR
jgi:hypothetical protein